MKVFLFVIFSLIYNSIFCQLIDVKETTFNSKESFINDNYFRQVVKSKKDDKLINGEVKFSNGILDFENGGIVRVTYLYPNGNMKERFEYKNGLQNGLQEYYYKNGNLSQSFNLNSENPTFVNTNDSWNHKQYIVGYNKRYYKNGQLMFEENSNKNGNLDGIQKYFYKSGQMAKQAIYQDGNLLEIECWDRKGQKVKC